MALLVTVASWSGLALVAGLGIAVLWRLADGTIALDGLLEGDFRNARGVFGTYSSWGRAQALVVSLFAAAFYLKQLAQDPTHFPEVPPFLLVSLGASHALYLGGKAKAALIEPTERRLK